MAEWMAYAKLEPFGERHRDASLGIIGAAIANFAMRTKKLKTPFEPKQFMIPTFADQKPKNKKMSPASIKDFFISLRDSMNLKRKKKNG